MKILSSILIAFIYLSLLYICVIMFSAHGMHNISLNDIFKISVFIAPIIMIMCLIIHLVIKKINVVFGYSLIAISIYAISYLNNVAKQTLVLACLYYLLVFYLLRLFNDFRSKLGKK
ncbi:putative membrane protein [Campylobacter sp. RM5004]|uniref:hypothetical protein n=1 Tax=Campylobacter sp. RM5004 TaxID=1660078 RepID=UPI001EFA3651|nr:hypothetical protein [Campylobacter sp. RM5004]ULO01494.1 putative membrane protein [Campylobacter sp. RM5004]